MSRTQTELVPGQGHFGPDAIPGVRWPVGCSTPPPTPGRCGDACRCIAVIDASRASNHVVCRMLGGVAVRASRSRALASRWSRWKLLRRRCLRSALRSRRCVVARCLEKTHATRRTRTTPRHRGTTAIVHLCSRSASECHSRLHASKNTALEENDSVRDGVWFARRKFARCSFKYCSKNIIKLPLSTVRSRSSVPAAVGFRIESGVSGGLYKRDDGPRNLTERSDGL